MKYSLLHKTFAPLLLGLCMSAAVFGGHLLKAGAAEAVMHAGNGDGILQSGDLLTNYEWGIAALDDQTCDYSGAEEAMLNALERSQTSVNLSAFQIPVSDCTKVFSSFVNNHPQFFYLDSKYYYWESNGCLAGIEFCFAETDETVRNQMIAKYEDKVQEILSDIDDSWSDLEKALYVNDYLAVNCEYDLSFTNHSSYNALIDGSAVCQGYALAYQDLMNRLGISSELVSSAALNHAWNLIRIGNSWYHVDVTWNDPIYDQYGRASHLYLMKSTEWFKTPSAANAKSHQADDYLYSGPAGSSEAFDTGYDDYFWNAVNSAFYFYNGNWYTNVSNSLKIFSGSNAGMTETGTLKTLSDCWYVWGSSSYWTGVYGGCCILGNTLYYATPTTIQALNLAEGADSASTVFTLSDTEQTEGYIYGFYVTNEGLLQYGIAQSPNVAAAKKSTVLHTHSFGEWVVTRESSCTEDGERTQTCSTCGLVEKEEIPAEGHTPGDEATCTKPQVCLACGETLTPAKGHTLSAEPTCTEPQICTVCDEVLVPAKGHNYDDGVITRKPSCTKTGITTFTCTACGDTYTEQIDMIDHTSGPEPTCSEPQVCTMCGEELAPAKGHNYDDGVITRKPSCTETGINTFTCTVCGDTYTETIDIIDHTPGPEPTCSEPQACTMCGEELAPAKGHNYDDGVITRKPSCTETGITTFTCTVCGDTYTEQIDMVAHTPGDEATCTEDQTCTVCGIVLTPAKGHVPDHDVSCTEDQTCTVCGIVLTPATNHTPGPEATCTAPQTCTACGIVLAPVKNHTPGPAATCTSPQTCTVCRTVLTPAKGHTPGAAATCTSPQTCTSCGTTLANAAGHLHTTTKTTKAATFLKTGKASVICKDCGKTIQTRTLAKIKCKKGQTYTVGNYKYKIVSAKTNGKGTVAFTGLAKNVKKVTINNTVTIHGAKFQIVQIGDRALKNKTAITSVTIGTNVKTIGKEAFYGTKKLKTITIKSTKITKVGSNALKNIYAKAKIKVPKAKLKKYTTLFKSKGQKKTVKIY